MDTEYADAIIQLQHEIDRACARAGGILSNREIAEELRAIASSLELEE